MKHADESRDLGTRWLSGEGIFRNYSQQFLRWHDHDFTFDLEFLCQLHREFLAQRRLLDVSADHERADRADIHDLQFLQLLYQLGRFAKVSASNIDCAKENDQSHGLK